MLRPTAFFLVGLLVLQRAYRTRSLKVVPDPAPSFGHDEFRYVVGINSEGSDGTPHRCLVPLEKEDFETNDDPPEDKKAQDSEASLKVAKEGNIWSYLDRLSTLCFYRSEGWWVFELCYGVEVKQSHKDKDESMNLEYVLGRFDPEEETIDVIQEEKVNGRVKKFISQHYFNGDMCEQTGAERETEVRYYCEERSQISYTSLVAVTEGPTCHYVVTVHTPLLCKHPAFKLQDPTRLILCNSVDGNEVEQEKENSDGEDGAASLEESKSKEPDSIKDEL